MSFPMNKPSFAVLSPVSKAGRLLLILVLLLQCFAVTAATVSLTAWKFRAVGERKWMSATVPGTVQSDLLRLKKIPDPYAESNEKQVQWVGRTDWEYSCSFSCTPEQLRAAAVQLVFEGLDTYAAVYLNGVPVVRAENMFVRYAPEVKQLLRIENQLRIVFSAPEAVAAAAAAKLPYRLPEGLRSFTRKAQYQYGWDWGPKILTCGIWKNVYLHYFGEVEPLAIRMRRVNGRVEAAVRVFAAADIKTALQLSSVAGRVKLLHECSLRAGTQWVTIPVPQEQISEWNPWQLGEQPCYDYAVKVPGTAEEVRCTTGFRTTELIRERDSTGTSFGFRINGRAVFARGANLIPPHLFLPGVKDADYEQLVQRARAANCNMLRVWGGGAYLPEIFYSLCDKYGIMVWQDFMFACSMVPGDTGFLNNVREEAAQQMARISAHPSVVLWCGNNESDEGWHNWGWQKQFGYSPADSTEIWNSYCRVFHQLLPAITDSLSNGIPYISTSPRYGWGRPESMQEGDSHYWGVWWGMEPFEKYREKVPRFMSEFGFQSLPAPSAWNKVIRKLSRTQPAFRNHQKHPRGFEIIDTMLLRYFFVPPRFDDYSYVSQLQQAYGMKMAIDAHRSSYPYCRGSLFWQWNDCWPSVSWSAMDHRYRPKILYYEARRLFAPLYCGTSETDKGLTTVLHYDGGAPLNINLRTYFISSFKPVPPALLDERDLQLEGDTMIPAAIRYPAEYMRAINSKETVIVSEAYDKAGQNIIGRNFLLRCRPNELKLDTAHISRLVFTPGVLILTSDVFAYGVWLYDEKGVMEFEENGFHLLPGEQKEVRYSGGNEAAIRVKCLNNLLLQADPGK